MAALVIQGASSSAGTSPVTAGLARALHRRGVDVVPFKAPNKFRGGAALPAPVLDQVFDRLADPVEEHLDVSTLLDRARAA